jgi:hypothetical protein
MAIRVLHVFFDLSTGGVERLITDLALGLTGPSFHISAATYQDGPFGAQIRESGGDVSVFGAAYSPPSCESSRPFPPPSGPPVERH